MTRTGWMLFTVGLVVPLCLVARPACTKPLPSTISIARSQAHALSRLIVTGVQQAISSRPPASGQSIIYDFDLAVGAWKRSENLAPASFTSPQTLGRGRFSLRAAFTYLELSRDFGPILYDFFDTEQGGKLVGTARVGLSARAKTFVSDISLTYGVVDDVDVTLEIPVVTVDASATEVYSAFPDSLDNYGGAQSPEPVDQAIGNGTLVINRAGLGFLGASFHDDTRTGIGRIGLSGRWLAYSLRENHPDDGLDLMLAFSLKLSFPSAYEDEFAGSDSFAILPRSILQLSYRGYLPRLHLDMGYEYDVRFDELRRFVWSIGTSVPLRRFLLDMGVTGSKYASSVAWTVPAGSAAASPEVGFPTTTYVAHGKTATGDNLVDFVVGLKYEILADTVLVGNVFTPLNRDGFRPAAAGTAAIEYYF